MSGGTYCYLGAKRRRGESSLLVRFLILLLTFLLIFLLLNFQFTPILTELATLAVTMSFEERIADAIRLEMSRDPLLYSDVVKISYKQDGSVASLTTNTQRLIAVRTALSLAVVKALSQEEALLVRVPIASLFSMNLLPSSPDITLSLRLLRSFNAYFLSRFEERGINQTRHSICFCISVDVMILIPGKRTTVTVVRELPFAETVIVGEVPDAYTKIHRLTDDITETEIDDIYDFGASNYN